VLRGQGNDAYWHGVFGGIYAPHLRTEIWRNLISGRGAGRPAYTRRTDARVEVGGL